MFENDGSFGFVNEEDNDVDLAVLSRIVTTSADIPFSTKGDSDSPTSMRRPRRLHGQCGVHNRVITVLRKNRSMICYRPNWNNGIIRHIHSILSLPSNSVELRSYHFVLRARD